ncbi:MAG: SRPBCC domain-containing protein [Pseudomonadota bacterium]
MNAPVPEMTGPTSLMIRRTFEADIETLFQALTDPKAWLSWFGGGKATPINATADLVVGGDWRIDLRGGDGTAFGVFGAFTEIDAPNTVSFTWAWTGTPERVSQVTYRLSAVDADRTTLTLTHDRFFDSDARDGHAGGWSATLELLESYLETEGAA